MTPDSLIVDLAKKTAKSIVDHGSIPMATLKESIKLHDKVDELLSKEIEIPEPLEEVSVKNFPDVQKVEVINHQEKELQKVEVVNFPEQKAPVVNVPAPIVNVPPAQVSVTVPEIKVPQTKVNIKTDKIEETLTSIKNGLEELNGETKKGNFNKASAYPSGVIASSVRVKNLLDQQINPATSGLQEQMLNLWTDSARFDSFSRLRTSNPVTLFDAQFTYGLAPLLYEPITAESGATVTHDTTDRCALMTFTSTPTGGKAYMQTYEYFRYQPAKSQLAFVTFNMNGGVANVLKFAGYSDGVNGIEFQLNGTQPRLALYSDTEHGDEFVNQADWNLDCMDGRGTSGITLDFTKTQILVIDFQALYVGRVRIGFDVGGVIYYVHQFTHANIDTSPYIQSANLPIRCGMTCTGTVSTTMKFICCSVISEGGQEETTGYAFSQEGTVTAGNGTDTHILSVQPKTTFNSITNRSKFILESLDITVTGNTPVIWKLVIGQALSGTTTFIEENATYSAFEYNILGTLSGSPAIVIAQGYVAASATAKTATSTRVPFKYPITLNAAGTARVNGRLTVIVRGLGATSATRCVLNWREIR